MAVDTTAGGTMRLREFNDEGVARFRAYLFDARARPDAAVPWPLLEDGAASRPVSPAVSVARPGFPTKRSAAEYLDRAFAPLAGRDVLNNRGLWTWLTLYYFEDVCPSRAGRRKVQAESRYVAAPDDTRYVSRHLLAAPYLILKASPAHNCLLLDAPLLYGKLVEEVGKRLFLLRLPCVMEALDRLYFDHGVGSHKAGLAPWPPQAGDLKTRLPLRVRQLQRTYDLNVLSADQLLELLGDEFRRWLPPPPLPGMGPRG